jgi:two-component system, sensor histidine kinase and response regulator
VTESVLVVDDSDANRRLLEGHLVAAGYEVIMASDGERALELFRRVPDLVLLDILMPGMDGFATCRAMRSLPGGGDVPIVFLTALSDLGTHQIAMGSGADDFLTKPINRTELLIRVRSLLRLRRASRRVRELTSFILHDLKNPLATILANSQSLRAGGYGDADVREAMTDVEISARSMLRMVLNLLDVGEDEERGMRVVSSPVDIAELVGGVLALMRPRFAERELRLVLEVPVATAELDRDLVRRILENLVDNCVKHSPAGGAVRVAARLVDDGIELRVSDEGPGIPAELRERIFDKYVQLDDRRGVSRAGRGLGLAFCRAAAEAHGGRVWIEPGETTGTTFVVRLSTPPNEARHAVGPR